MQKLVQSRLDHQFKHGDDAAFTISDTPDSDSDEQYRLFAVLNQTMTYQGGKPRPDHPQFVVHNCAGRGGKPAVLIWDSGAVCPHDRPEDVLPSNAMWSIYPDVDGEGVSLAISNTAEQVPFIECRQRIDSDYWTHMKTVFKLEADGTIITKGETLEALITRVVRRELGK